MDRTRSPQSGRFRGTLHSRLGYRRPMFFDKEQNLQPSLNLMFDKGFLFNWTPNPARPGVVDAVVFMLKDVIIGGLFVLLFAMLGYPLIGILIWAATIEEQAMVTWMKNADHPMRAAVVFRTALVLTEYLLFGIPVGAFESVGNALAHLEDRMWPNALHLGMLVLACILMRRQVPWFRIWLVCAICHLSYNSAISFI